MPPKTLQIALMGGNEDAVFVGLRNFPAHKVALLSLTESRGQADLLAEKLTGTLRLPVEVIPLKDENISTMLEAVGQILKNESGNFHEFLLNVGSASKHLTSAGVTAAFVYGMKAFDVVGEQPMTLPIMQFSYTQAISKPKMEILLAIEKSGGDVESLEKLSQLAGYGKPLLSYHIRGSGDGQGLADLGLVEVERGKRGRLRVKLTALGRMLLSTAAIKAA
jgi:hypothetical protein